MDEDLPRGWLDVLDSVVQAEWAWTPADRLDAGTVAELTAAGWLERWDGALGADGMPCGPSVTLTPWAAERLRTTIIDATEVAPALDECGRPVVAEKPPRKARHDVWQKPPGKSGDHDWIDVKMESRDEEPRWGELIEDERLLDEKGLPRYSPLPNWDELPTPRRRIRSRPYDRKDHWFDRLPDRRAVQPEDAVMMAEEIEEGTNRPKLDPETGRKMKRPVVVWGKKAKAEDEGLKGGLDGRHDGRIPVDPRIKGKKGKGKSIR